MLGHIGSHVESILQRSVVHISSISLVSGKILVAWISHREAQLQPICPITHEILIVNIPCQADRPTRRKTLIGTEYGRPVRTNINVEQITVVIGIVAVPVQRERLHQIVARVAQPDADDGERDAACSLVLNELRQLIGIGDADVEVAVGEDDHAVVAVDDEDVRAFKRLRELGVNLFIQRVPDIAKEDVENLFK